jgi:hypothetical protein
MTIELSLPQAQAPAPPRVTLTVPLVESELLSEVCTKSLEGSCVAVQPMQTPVDQVNQEKTAMEPVTKEYQEFAAKKYLEISKLNARVKELEEKLAESKKHAVQVEELARVRRREAESVRLTTEQKTIEARGTEERMRRKKVRARAILDYLQAEAQPQPPQTPLEWVQMLSGEELRFPLSLRNVLSLKHAIRTAEKEWLAQFVGSCHGLHALAKAIAVFRKPRKNLSPLAAAIIQLYLVLCIKAISNTASGLDAIIADMAAIPNLVNTIQRSRNLFVRAQVLEICAALIRYSHEGERVVRRAFDAKKGTATQRAMKYEFVVRWMCDNEEFPQLPRACLLLVNAIVNSSRDLSKRCARRDMFISLRLLGILETIKSEQPQLAKVLSNQIDFFFQRMNEDALQLKERRA